MHKTKRFTPLASHWQCTILDVCKWVLPSLIAIGFILLISEINDVANAAI